LPTGTQRICLRKIGQEILTVLIHKIQRTQGSIKAALLFQEALRR
jgi:hypothetical protein